ncbi:hypothetical protein HAP48_0027770 [Bradyrhizobium septentrionale]|uniref:hypothetical protein n=1 Tax=Bradyrhizobium septentrionale TaxID=1404411 RepID=UPI001AEDE9EA|nr:hypothetical protein [Bradyrhizobium septentrionale]UGY20867.1 hypothetical protein HAP48_0027770 [Bradyrhizobium septentrionale]UGY29912.1 hypothetical protein HU675_0023690 [Bradyrhizobium septentrionale]
MLLGGSSFLLRGGVGRTGRDDAADEATDQSAAIQSGEHEGSAARRTSVAPGSSSGGAPAAKMDSSPPGGDSRLKLSTTRREVFVL